MTMRNGGCVGGALLGGGCGVLRALRVGRTSTPVLASRRPQTTRGVQSAGMGATAGLRTRYEVEVRQLQHGERRSEVVVLKRGPGKQGAGGGCDVSCGSRAPHVCGRLLQRRGRGHVPHGVPFPPPPPPLTCRCTRRPAGPTWPPGSRWSGRRAQSRAAPGEQMLVRGVVWVGAMQPNTLAAAVPHAAVPHARAQPPWARAAPAPLTAAV